MKAANPDYKVGDIAKVLLLPMYFRGIRVHGTQFSETVMLQAIGQMWKELDEKEKVTAVLNVTRLILILL